MAKHAKLTDAEKVLMRKALADSRGGKALPADADLRTIIDKLQKDSEGHRNDIAALKAQLADEDEIEGEEADDNEEADEGEEDEADDVDAFFESEQAADE